MGWGGTQGTAGWGGVPWGSGGTGLKLVSAEAVRENVVRIGFNVAPRFTGILDPNDAADVGRYALAVVAGTVGLDNLPVRPVSPAAVALAEVSGGAGKYLDITVDRPFSPWPCKYKITVVQVVSQLGGLLVPGFTSVTFDAVFKGIAPAVFDQVVARRDIANPQTLESLLESSSGSVIDPELLGSYLADGQGDYARDEGITSYKKRIFRRLITRKGAFAHLPDYGVGVPDQVKRLGSFAVKQALAADAEAQIRLEPETLDATVEFVNLPEYPALVFLRVRARMATGEAVSMDVPFSPVGD